MEMKTINLPVFYFKMLNPAPTAYPSDYTFFSRVVKKREDISPSTISKQQTTVHCRIGIYYASLLFTLTSHTYSFFHKVWGFFHKV